MALRPYPIGTAARLAGLAPEVVRMWEKRYGLLAPDRTDGGHRLYSEEDVRVLQAVKRLLDEGMRIGTVARLPQDRILAEADKLAPVEPVQRQSLLGDREALIDDVLRAARDLDTARVSALLDRPRLLVDGADVILELYLPLLVRLGDLWHAGELSPAVEHFVEKLVTARLHALFSSTPSAGNGRLALLACLPGERHEAGLLATAVFLKRAGFEVVVLGADLPVVDLELAARTTAPAVVVLASTVLPRESVLREAAEAFARAPLAELPLVVGGPTARAIAGGLGAKSLVVARDIASVASDVQRALR